MTSAAWLLLYALVVSTLGGRALTVLTRGGRCPRLAVAAWQMASFSALLTAVCAAMLIAVPGVGPLHDASHLMRFCWAATHDVTSGTASRLLRVLSLVAFLALSMRFGWCLVAEGLRLRRGRRHHDELVRVVACHDSALQATVLPSTSPFAYCVPGRRPRIVISTAAIAALPTEQVRAILGHERAHAHARHHIPVLVGRALAQAYPGIPLFAAASAGIRESIEMCADDVAARRFGGSTVARALLGLSAAQVPTSALGGVGEATALRIDRLLNPDRGGKGRSRLGLSFALGGSTVSPAVAVMMPVLLEGWEVLQYCPLLLE